MGQRLTNRRWAVGCFGWHFGTVRTEDTFGLNPRLTRWIIKAWQGDWMPLSCQLPCFCWDKTLVLMTDLDVINTVWSPSIIDEEPDQALRFLLLSVELEAWRLWKKEEERGWNKERRNDAERKERNICEEVVHVRRRGWTIEDRDGYLHLRKTALILWSAGCRDKDERGNETGTAEKGERHKERLVFNSFGKETKDRKWRRKRKGAWLRQNAEKYVQNMFD